MTNLSISHKKNDNRKKISVNRNGRKLTASHKSHCPIKTHFFYLDPIFLSSALPHSRPISQSFSWTRTYVLLNYQFTVSISYYQGICGSTFFVSQVMSRDLTREAESLKHLTVYGLHSASYRFLDVIPKENNASCLYSFSSGARPSLFSREHLEQSERVERS